MQFYLLRQPKPNSLEDIAGRSDAIHSDGSKYGEAKKCPTCHRFLTALKWLPPFCVELESWGKAFGDIVQIDDDLIVSERFKELFTNEGLRGLENFEPVTVAKVYFRRGSKKNKVPRYYKATVTRSTTKIDQEASGYIWEDKTKICPDCLYDTLKRHTSLHINEYSWNGDDVFFPRGGNGPIVSERFRLAFVNHGLLGAIFIPVETYGYDYYPWESKVQMKNQ